MQKKKRRAPAPPPPQPPSPVVPTRTQDMEEKRKSAVGELACIRRPHASRGRMRRWCSTWTRVVPCACEEAAHLVLCACTVGAVRMRAWCCVHMCM